MLAARCASWLTLTDSKGSRFEHSTSNTQRSTSKEIAAMTAERKRYDLEDRLLDYAAEIIRLTDGFPNTSAWHHVSSQLLRSGTSPLSNHGEAQAAESAADFVHKLKICLNELRESKRWLRLSLRVSLGSEEVLSSLLQETEELIRIFVASIKTVSRKSASAVREESAAYDLTSVLDVERWTLDVFSPARLTPLFSAEAVHSMPRSRCSRT